MSRLLRAELARMLAGRTWWIFAAAGVAYTAIMVIYFATSAKGALAAPPPSIPAGMPAAAADSLRSQWLVGASPVKQAATLYDAGTTVGWLLTMLLGILSTAGEFRYRTASTTFLLASRRAVIFAKLAVAVLLAVGLWLANTILATIAGAQFLHQLGFGSQLLRGPVIGAMLLNLAVYAAWAAIGVALGSSFRSQVPLISCAIGGYLLGAPLTKAMLLGVSLLGHLGWVTSATVALPATAGQVMIAGVRSPGDPAPWIGALIMAGYGLVAVAVAVSAVTRRDIGPAIPRALRKATMPAAVVAGRSAETA